MTATEHWVAQFRAVQADLPGANGAWLDGLRRAALARFAALGYPGPPQEEWKYTDMRPVERRHFQVPTQRTAIDSTAIADYRLNAEAVHELVFVDGHYAPGCSRMGSLPDGVTVADLGSDMEKEPVDLQAHLGRYAPADANGFSALNAVFMSDGASIALAPGTRVEVPIHLLFISTGDGQAVHLRNLVVADPDSHAVIIETHAGIGEGERLTNVVTELALERGADVEHYKWVRDGAKTFHIAGTQVRQGHDSRYARHTVTTGGRLVRDDLTVALLGEGAQCALNGLAVADGRRHVDNHVRIDHQASRATSRAWYKGIVDGRSRSVFAGRIVVHPDAQGADARQVNNHLLLSRDAEADSKPQLEIYADDVKCSHGATVGQLDGDALFYLRSRGIDERAARRVLVYGFAADLVQGMSLLPLRRQLERQLGGTLLSGPDRGDPP